MAKTKKAKKKKTRRTSPKHYVNPGVENVRT